MTAYHTEFDASHAHIGAAEIDLAQRRANIARRAEIMAQLYADRRLSPATGCAAFMAGTHRAAASCDQQQGAVCAPSNAAQCEHCAPPVRECQMCGSTDPAHRVVCEQLHPGVCEWLPADDTEGGAA